MDAGKYIIVDGIPIIFSGLHSHREIFLRVFGADKVIDSAGFVSINSAGAYSCYGSSVTMKIGSRPAEDSKILNRMLGGADSYD